MPFTLAHPALVLPLNWFPKKWFSLTGLVIGSMIPDFEPFLRMKAHKSYTHTFDGSLWLGLPVAIVLAFVFHNLVKGPLFNSLPAFLFRRFAVYTSFNWNKYFLDHWLIVLVSFLIGIISHFFWDGFSHYDGFVVKHLPALQRDTIFLGKTIEIPFLIQYINTVLGLLVVTVAIAQLPARNLPRTRENPFLFWLTMLPTTAIIILLRTSTYDIKDLDDLVVIITAALAYAVTFSACTASFFRKVAHKNG